MTMYPSGKNIIYDADAAAVSDAGCQLGKCFRSTDGYIYRMVKQATSQSAGKVLQLTTNGDWEVNLPGADLNILGKPAGIAVSSASGTQPVLVHGEYSAVYIAPGTDNAVSAGQWLGYDSDGAAVAYTTATVPTIKALESAATSASAVTKSCWVQFD